MNNAPASMAITIAKILLKSDAGYVHPSWKKTTELLKKFHGVIIRRSWCFAVMARLTAAGFFIRKKIYYRDTEGNIHQAPGILFPTFLFCAYLRNKGFNGVERIADKIRAWIDRKDGRYPDVPARPEDPPGGPGSRSGETQRIDSRKPPDKTPKQFKDIVKDFLKTVNKGVLSCF